MTFFQKNLKLVADVGLICDARWKPTPDESQSCELDVHIHNQIIKILIPGSN